MIVFWSLKTQSSSFCRYDDAIVARNRARGGSASGEEHRGQVEANPASRNFSRDRNDQSLKKVQVRERVRARSDRKVSLLKSNETQTKRRLPKPQRQSKTKQTQYQKTQALKDPTHPLADCFDHRIHRKHTKQTATSLLLDGWRQAASKLATPFPTPTHQPAALHFPTRRQGDAGRQKETTQSSSHTERRRASEPNSQGQLNLSCEEVVRESESVREREGGSGSESGRAWE